ncbi:MAG: ABC transporter permease subunit [Nitriliruptorales bacterium]
MSRVRLGVGQRSSTRAERGVSPALLPGAGVATLAALGGVFLALPLLALVVAGGLAELGDALTDPAVLTALRLTVVTSTLATVVAVVTGVPLALVAERGRAWVRGAAGVIGELPFVVPPVVTGLGLLLVFGREGLLGGALRAARLELGFTPSAVVLAEASVAIPLVVLAVRAGIAALDPAPELAAAALGAGPARRLRLATLPALRGPILLGAALAWGRAAGEFGATITYAGSLPGRTRTVPLEIFNELQRDPRRAAAAALLQLLIAAAVLIVARSFRDRADRGDR